MTVGGLAAVFERIDAIESRFGRRAPEPAPAPAATPAPTIGPAEPAVAPDFAHLVEQAQFVGWPTPAPVSPMPVGSPLDQLAAIGALPVGGHHHGAPVMGDTAGHAHDGHVHGSTAVGAAGATTPFDSTATGHVPPGTPFAAQFEAAGARHGVPPRLLAAVGWVESRYQTDALSPDGAIGVMQIMPMTAQELGVDPHDPVQAIDGAAALLADHRRRFGSWELALAAYHSGPGAVSRAGNQAPPRGAAYAQRVLDRLDQM